LRTVIQDSKVDLQDIEAVAVGTTHFVNALVERNDEFLERVAVIRLCGAFTRGSPPFASFPYELRASECERASLSYDIVTEMTFNINKSSKVPLTS
jgi:hypothetical protein